MHGNETAYKGSIKIWLHSSRNSSVVYYDAVVSRVGCLGCYRFRILLISRDTCVIRDMMTTVYKYIQWRFICSNYDTISVLVRDQTPNTKDVIRCVLSRTACPLYLAANVVGQAGGLTVLDADCQHEEVNKVLRDWRLVVVRYGIQCIVLTQRQIKIKKKTVADVQCSGGPDRRFLIQTC